MTDYPATPMHEAATELHEMFQSFVKAGFSRKEALYLAGQYLAAAIHNGKPGEDTP